MRTLLCMALVLLFTAGCGVTPLEQPARGDEETEAAKTKVVYSTKNIEEGEIIAMECLEERDVETSKAPIDAFNTVNAVVGQVAAYPIPAGTVVSNHAVKPMALARGFDSKIPEGMRALTFGVDALSDVGGFVAPGSHVDVLGITGSGKNLKVTTLMPDLEVIAVGATFQKAPGEQTANPAGSVTVVVDPNNAEKLVKALADSRAYLTLRPEEKKPDNEDDSEGQSTDEHQ